MSLIEVGQPWTDAYDGSPDFDGVNTVLGLAPAAGVYTATQNIAANVLTVRSGVRLQLRGYCIWARTLIVETGGFISANGNSATNETGGTGLSNSGYLAFTSGSGANADQTNAALTSKIGATSSSTTNSVGANGGNGGASSGAAGGTAGTATALSGPNTRLWRSADMPNLNWRLPSTGAGTAWVILSAGTGGGSGALTSTTQTGAFYLYGGGGGAGGGVFAIRCGILRNSGTIEARGGDGASGRRSGTSIEGNAGGGGGGSGGSIHLCTDLIANLGTISVAGGAGAPAVLFGSGLPAVNGSNGNPGTLSIFLRGQPI